MDNKNTLGIDSYAHLLLQVNNLINCSFQEIKNKFADYPHCEIYYFEKEMKDKSIEIRLDREEVTLTCSFNSDETSESILLLPDKEETIHGLIGYLNKMYDYDFIKKRWITPDCFIKIREQNESVFNVCFLFVSKG